MPGTGAGSHTAPFSRMPRPLRAALFYLIQWTWGLPQNALGLMVSLFALRAERRRYHGAVAALFGEGSPLPQSGAFSLGTFIFIPRAWGEELISRTLPHEYGHTVQSMILGPLYLPLVALPSVVWSAAWPRMHRRARHMLDLIDRGAAPRRMESPEIRRLIERAEVRYTSRYPENWANALGELATGEKPLEN